MPDGVRITAAKGVTEVTLDRPPVNALAHETILSLAAAVSAADPALPVLLTGAGDAFCAGVDTKAFGSYPPAGKAAMVRAITRMTAALLAHPAPLIAAVNGHALGGGFVLMLCADLRLVTARPGARFGLTEAKAGVPFPAGPLEIIRAEVEPSLLRRMTLTSEVLAADSLLNGGIADRIIPESILIDSARSLAAETASQPAFGVVKRQLRGDLLRRVQALATSGDDPLARSLES